MRNKRMMIITLLALILVIGGCSNQREIEGIKQLEGSVSSISINLEPEEYGKEIERIINGIDEWYAHTDRKNIDSQYLRETYIGKAESADRFSELHTVLLQLFSELENGHSNVFAGVPEYGVSIRVKLIEDKVVITSLGDLGVPDVKVDMGFVVEEIDQQPVKEWMEERFSLISASTPQALWQESLEWIFKRYAYEHETREYLIRSPQGEEFKVELSLSTPGYDLGFHQRPIVETGDFGNYGYIALNTMMDGIVEAFDEALAKMIEKEGIIIDLRNNGGGNSANGDQMIRRLIQEKTDIWQGRSAEPCDKLNYSGKVIALIGPRTFSAAESFAFDLHDSGRVLTMGEATMGDSGGGPVSFQTDGGIYFRIPTRGVDTSASGLLMEGKGLEPHVFVEQTYEDFLEGSDTPLEAARKELLEKSDGKSDGKN